MASPIQPYLDNILNAIFGREVRSSIHDAIEQCYTDVSTGTSIAHEAAEEARQATSTLESVIANATDATASANQATGFANTAASNANAAASSANTAKTNANEATTQANAARDSANQAASSANAAATLASQAASDADSATSDALAAASAANTAAGQANTARDSANVAAGNANTAANTATTAASNADSKASLATTATTNANTATSQANIATTQANAARDSANQAASSANAAATLAGQAALDADSAKSAALIAASDATTATSQANTAIATINQKITDCESAISDATAAKNSADVATTSANRAAGRADTAAATIENLTVTSEDAPPSTPAEATITTINNHKNIHFVLRQGRQGAPFTVKGDAYDTLAELQADITNPEIGDQYNVGTSVPYNIYRWTGTVWEDQGKIGSNAVEIANEEIDAIINNREVDPTNKALGVTGFGYFFHSILSSLLANKVDKVANKGLSTNDFTTSYKDTIDENSAQITVLARNKVDKVANKGLSTNDFTNALYDKLILIEPEATKTIIDSSVSTTSTNPLQNKIITEKFIDVEDEINDLRQHSSDSTILKYTDIAVPVSSWVNDLTYNDYPKKATITCQGVTNILFPIVTFSLNDINSGNYLSIAESGENTVSIFAKEVPSSQINIPTIIAFKMSSMVKFTDVVVPTSLWVNDNTYSNYTKKASISCQGVANSLYPIVAFSSEDIDSGNYLSIAESGENTISIFAKEVPNSQLTIPSIIAFK